jgi:hypothetical protein
LLTGCSTLVLVSCGGSGEQKANPHPTIAANVASPLAARSDKVATLLDGGDACGAAREAAALRAELTQAIDKIPELYLEDLSALVNEIQAQIPPCPQPPQNDDDDNGDQEKKGKNGKKGKEHGKHKHHEGQEGTD